MPAEPQPVRVLVDEQGQPKAVELRGRLEPVRVHNRWSENAGWWSQPVRRQMFKVLTRSGTVLVVGRDEASGAWYVARVLD
ncbi:MAG: hypothetical protein HY331_12960 [Chloroflexi bacterium]|nr:hypothetical protein [Chloroflexota bacterium]